jgi:hypothetical protein
MTAEHDNAKPIIPPTTLALTMWPAFTVVTPMSAKPHPLRTRAKRRIKQI